MQAVKQRATEQNAGTQQAYVGIESWDRVAQRRCRRCGRGQSHRVATDFCSISSSAQLVFEAGSANTKHIQAVEQGELRITVEQMKKVVLINTI